MTIVAIAFEMVTTTWFYEKTMRNVVTWLLSAVAGVRGRYNACSNYDWLVLRSAHTRGLVAGTCRRGLLRGPVSWCVVVFSCIEILVAGTAFLVPATSPTN